MFEQHNEYYKEPLNGATWKFEAAILDQDILEFIATQHDNKTGTRSDKPASSRGVSVYFDISGVKKAKKTRALVWTLQN